MYYTHSVMYKLQFFKHLFMLLTVSNCILTTYGMTTNPQTIIKAPGNTRATTGMITLGTGIIH